MISLSKTEWDEESVIKLTHVQNQLQLMEQVEECKRS